MSLRWVGRACRSADDNTYNSEIAWSGAAAERSVQPTPPINQVPSRLASNHSRRGVDADPNTGVAVATRTNTDNSGPWVELGDQPRRGGRRSIANQGACLQRSSGRRTWPGATGAPPFHRPTNDITTGDNGSSQARLEATGWSPNEPGLMADLSPGTANHMGVRLSRQPTSLMGDRFGMLWRPRIWDT